MASSILPHRWPALASAQRETWRSVCIAGGSRCGPSPRRGARRRTKAARRWRPSPRAGASESGDLPFTRAASLSRAWTGSASSQSSRAQGTGPAAKRDGVPGGSAWHACRQRTSSRRGTCPPRCGGGPGETSSRSAGRGQRARRSSTARGGGWRRWRRASAALWRGMRAACGSPARDARWSAPRIGTTASIRWRTTTAETTCQRSLRFGGWRSRARPPHPWPSATGQWQGAPSSSCRLVGASRSVCSRGTGSARGTGRRWPSRPARRGGRSWCDTGAWSTPGDSTGVSGGRRPSRRRFDLSEPNAFT
mmetsp:Transcript_2132/g.7110  ORF Transcript_2132/g.7110 Transcript_2132/m.7110 type:complete len:307 (+) Transcript_2132:460-1380(+)